MNRSLESLGRVRLQALLLLLVVFAVGVLCGVAYERARGGAPDRFGPPPDGPHGLPPHIRDRLDLTPDQEQRIGTVMEKNRTRIDATLDQYLPQIRALTDSVRLEIRAILTPEQQAIFDKLERERSPEPPGGPGHDGPPPPGDDSPRPPPRR